MMDNSDQPSQDWCPSFQDCETGRKQLLMLVEATDRSKDRVDSLLATSLPARCKETLGSGVVA